MWGVGFALVDMRQRKLLKRFVATPMRRGDFLMALASSRLILMVIEVGLLLGFGIITFHLRVLGSFWSILLIGAIGAVAFGGLGLLTASRAKKIARTRNDRSVDSLDTSARIFGPLRPSLNSPFGEPFVEEEELLNWTERIVVHLAAQ